MRTLRYSKRIGCALAVGAALALAACSHERVRDEPFKASTPFSARLPGSGDAVCWSVKRAFLTQGYILERGGDTLILMGAKESQPDEDTNITLRMQATCVDNRDGTSTVFASAIQETSKLQKVGYSTTTGVSIFTLSVPSGTSRELRVQRRETIQDPKFYQSFYNLVQKFSSEETQASRH